jgi:hypothetical protein
MTVRDIIRTAFAGEYEEIEGDKDAARYLVDVMNELLADCYEAEQNSREVKRQDMLTEIPLVTSLDDEIPYTNMMLLRYALPHGIEWKHAEQNLDQYRADQYRAMYEDAKHTAGGGLWLI